VDDTAAKTGRSRSAVAQDVARAEALGDDIDRVSGTSLDRGIELDALAAMPAPARNEVISRFRRERQSITPDRSGGEVGAPRTAIEARPVRAILLLNRQALLVMLITMPSAGQEPPHGA